MFPPLPLHKPSVGLQARTIRKHSRIITGWSKMLSHAPGSKFTEGILQLGEHLFVNEAKQKCGNRQNSDDVLFMCAGIFLFFSLWSLNWVSITYNFKSNTENSKHFYACLLCAWHYSKGFTYANSFTPYKKCELTPSLFAFYGGKNKGTKKSNNTFKFSQLASDNEPGFELRPSNSKAHGLSYFSMMPFWITSQSGELWTSLSSVDMEMIIATFRQVGPWAPSS